jgi:hypothetical protein
VWARGLHDAGGRADDTERIPAGAVRLLAEYGSLIAELEMAIGRELPATDTTIVEET